MDTKDRDEVLREFGVTLLTGEACGVSMRILCDVDEKGKGLVETFLGVPKIDLYAPMNSGVGYVMLTRESIYELAQFALLTIYDVVAYDYYNYFCWKKNDREAQDEITTMCSLYNKKNVGLHVRYNTSTGHSLRNTHWFSGRTV